MDWGNNLRSGNQGEGGAILLQAETYADHIKGATMLSGHFDRRRPSTAQSNYQSGKLTRLFEKYEKKIRMQHHDPDKEIPSAAIARDFFLGQVDNTKAAEQQVSELRYYTRLKNQPSDPRKFLGSRPLSNSAYKHYLHWSRKAIAMEQKFRSYYNLSNAKVVQDHIVLLSCLANGTYLPVIDTFWTCDVNEDIASEEPVDRFINRLQSADHFDWGRNAIIKVRYPSATRIEMADPFVGCLVSFVSRGADTHTYTHTLF